MMLRYVILGLLRDENAYHGYALMREYRDATGVTLRHGNLYRELQRLRDLDLVRTVPNPAGADPRRAPYAITAKGAAAVERWLQSPLGIAVAERGRVDELVLGTLIVARSIGKLPEAVVTRWRDELALCRSCLQRQAVAVRTKGRLPVGRGERLLVALNGRRRKRIAADLVLVDEVRQALATDGCRDQPRKASDGGKVSEG